MKTLRCHYPYQVRGTLRRMARMTWLSLAVVTLTTIGAFVGAATFVDLMPDGSAMQAATLAFWSLLLITSASGLVTATWVGRRDELMRQSLWPVAADDYSRGVAKAIERTWLIWGGLWLAGTLAGFVRVQPTAVVWTIPMFGIAVYLSALRMTLTAIWSDTQPSAVRNSLILVPMVVVPAAILAILMAVGRGSWTDWLAVLMFAAAFGSLGAAAVSYWSLRRHFIANAFRTGTAAFETGTTRRRPSGVVETAAETD